MAGPKPFNDTIIALRYGTLHDDLTAALNKLTDDVTRTGKVGELKLSIKLKPTNNSGQIEVIDDIKVLEDAVQAVWTDVANSTELRVFNGKP